MGKFLVGKARVQQTDKKRIWKLLDNEVYKADDGKIYLAPRTMYSDFYTIPSWTAVIAGSPVDYDARASFVHDILCYCHESLLINLTEEELKEKGYLRYSEKVGMWVCEDVPPEYLRAVLSQVLKDIHDQGDRCFIKYEKKQNCFHITVRK